VYSRLDRWATRNDCNQEIVKETSDGGNVHHLSWTCNDTPGFLQHYSIDDMGHCWADTEPNLSQLSVPQLPGPIQASKVVMEFFDRFRKSD
jgi:poly(3-hydroxybutyrate) depolymerase